MYASVRRTFCTNQQPNWLNCKESPRVQTVYRCRAQKQSIEVVRQWLCALISTIAFTGVTTFDGGVVHCTLMADSGVEISTLAYSGCLARCTRSGNFTREWVARLLNPAWLLPQGTARMILDGDRFIGELCVYDLQCRFGIDEFDDQARHICSFANKV